MLPLLVYYLISVRDIPISQVLVLLPSFGFFFIILAALMPLWLSVNSLVGEKLEKSLEPLLATPTSDGEILLGKNIAAFIPTILCLILGEAVFVILADYFTAEPLGYLYFPNWTFTVGAFVAAPLATIFSTGFSIFTSSKTDNLQSAYMMGIIPLIPFFIMYVLGELGIFPVGDIYYLAAIAGCLVLADIAVYYLSTATFNRESILSDWK